MVTFGVVREFDNRQEEEADWLAGSLLVSEAALRRAKFARLTHAQTARRLGAWAELVPVALECQRHRPLPRPAPRGALHNDARSTGRSRERGRVGVGCARLLAWT